VMVALTAEALPNITEVADWLAEQFAPLRARAEAEMAAEGHGDIVLSYTLDMRYRGQSHELAIGLPEGLGDVSLARLAGLFHAAHEARYGYAQEKAVVELVTLRLTAVSPTPPPPLPYATPGLADATAAKIGTKQVWFSSGAAQETALYDRRKLRPGHEFSGPAVVFQYDTTLVIPPGWHGRVDGWGNLIVNG
ncbi:MAG: hypothetical protein KDD89_14000, partial [Anaerolineales bacterium]|nr:hypothetical protein [Anaerolineales bacterium]